MVNCNLSCFICCQAFEEHSLSAFENWVLRTVFGPRSKEMTGARRTFIMGSLIIYTLHQIPLKLLN
jgi:hypothetical protein